MDYNIQALDSVTTLVLVRLDECRKIAMLDSKVLSTNSDKFVKANTLTYYILLNTWGHQIMDISSEEAWVYIIYRIKSLGLVSVIRDTSDLADMIIHGEAPEWDYAFGYLSVLAKRDYSLPSADLQGVLQILRYPKRFSPAFADVVQSQSLEALYSFNSELKRLNRVEPSWYWLQKIKQRVHDMLKGFSFDLTEGYFSSGTSATTDRLLLSKLKEYSKTEPSLAGCPQFALSSSSGYYPRWRDTMRLREPVIVQAVPKSFKAARIIAKEPVPSAFALQAIAVGLRRALRNNGYTFASTISNYCVVDDTDQSISCQLCELASVDGRFSTIDLTSASDSLTENFVLSVLPSNVISALDKYRCMYLGSASPRGDSSKNPSSLRIMQMFATSGSPITFIVESIIFSAIALEATATVNTFTSEVMLPPRVYGDDIIIDDRACDTCVDILRAVGCKPNMGKTFSGSTTLGYYRESCGVEFLNGMPMHNRYFPRKNISCSPEGVALMCDLQHKLFDSWKTRLFLVQAITAFEPKMTSHPHGTNCDDLWDLIDRCADTVNKYSSLPHQWGQRRRYMCLKAQYPPQKLNADETALLDLWYYYSYLHDGPLYGDPLDRTLGVSTSRRHYRADSSASKSVWALRVE